MQVVFTSLFGLYAARIYVVTGSSYAAILNHSLCNQLGLPDMYYMHPNHSAYKYRSIISTAYIFGIIGFFFLIPLILDFNLYNSWPYLLSMQ